MKRQNSAFLGAAFPVIVAGIALATLVVAGAALAGPNGAKIPTGIQPNASVSGNPFSNISILECNELVTGSLNVTATGTTDDGGGNDTVYLNVWDDGVIKATVTWSIPVGSTTTTPVNFSYPGTIASGAPGVGLYFGETPTNGGGADTIYAQDPVFGYFCSIPTLSHWGMLAMIALLALAGAAFILLRRGRG